MPKRDAGEPAAPRSGIPPAWRDLAGLLRAIAGSAPLPRTLEKHPAIDRATLREILRTDGASRGNPGPSAAAVILESPDGREIARRGIALGHATNNQAEYQALILGLTLALEHGLARVEVLSDSELLVRQMEGEYQVKNAAIAALKRDAGTLALKFDSVAYHVPRAQNEAADKLANDVLDGK